MKYILEKDYEQWEYNDRVRVAIHSWLSRHYGKSSVCEFCGKSGLTGNAIHWAKKRGYEHSKNRDSYLRLCVKCHSNYDFTEEKRERLKQMNVINAIRLKGKKRNIPWIYKKVSAEKDGIIYNFNSVKEGSKKLNIKYSSSISDCLRGRNKTAGGYNWKYL